MSGNRWAVPGRFTLTAEYVERETQRPSCSRDAKYLFNIRFCRGEERGAHVDGDCVQAVVNDQIIAHLLEKRLWALLDLRRHHSLFA
jgi:hypothetical protein